MFEQTDTSFDDLSDALLVCAKILKRKLGLGTDGGWNEEMVDILTGAKPVMLDKFPNLG